MQKVDVTGALNRIVSMHARSLPVYLTDAVPYFGGGDDSIPRRLKSIADDQLETVNRMADHLQSLGTPVSPGNFPLYFANWHDLSAEFLTSKCVERQAADVAELESIVLLLADQPKSQSLVEEALGAAKGHLDTLADIRDALAT